MAEPMLPTDPMPGDYDSPDQEGERKRKAEASLREDRLRAVEAALIGTREGREWLWAFLTRLHVWEMRIAMSQSEYENGFMAGEREAGLGAMRRFAKVSPTNFGLMVAENDG
jgi:hypothetical protein